jgi:hypothetical protein
MGVGGHATSLDESDGSRGSGGGIARRATVSGDLSSGLVTRAKDLIETSRKETTPST